MFLKIESIWMISGDLKFLTSPLLILQIPKWKRSIKALVYNSLAGLTDDDDGDNDDEHEDVWWLRWLSFCLGPISLHLNPLLCQFWFGPSF